LIRRSVLQWLKVNLTGDGETT